ncbi:MAG: hypothetical protein ACI8YQ_001693 [Polaribacter sp.]|jgi:hypothetical protein
MNDNNLVLFILRGVAEAEREYTSNILNELYLPTFFLVYWFIVGL